MLGLQQLRVLALSRAQTVALGPSPGPARPVMQVWARLSAVRPGSRNPSAQLPLRHHRRRRIPCPGPHRPPSRRRLMSGPGHRLPHRSLCRWAPAAASGPSPPAIPWTRGPARGCPRTPWRFQFPTCGTGTAPRPARSACTVSPRPCSASATQRSSTAGSRGHAIRSACRCLRVFFTGTVLPCGVVGVI